MHENCMSRLKYHSHAEFIILMQDIVLERNCIRLGHYKLESNQSKVDKMCRRRSSYVILGFYPLFLINNLLYHCFLFYGSKNYWLQYKGKGVNNLVSFRFPFFIAAKYIINRCIARIQIDWILKFYLMKKLKCR